MVGRPSDAGERILAFLRAWEPPYAPSYREIAAGVGVSSTSVVGYHLRRLEKRGLIERVAGVARSISVVDE